MPTMEGVVVAVQIHLSPTLQRTTAALAIYELQGTRAHAASLIALRAP